MKAIWNNAILAESDRTIVSREIIIFLTIQSMPNISARLKRTLSCGWKGTASYYDVEANGATNKDAAWFYPETKPDAKEIENHVAFWKGVQVTA